ncbi:aldolase [Daedalea quercina L-15889]|uniref:hydroxymethylglutaryl-CoA lyase n=1 Tax=Daedalea quercina L-15889 TaxID=1314783 RepID=A0A165KGN0_9APHY|nr:aldolase [Daedalea quercina L-15889]
MLGRMSGCYALPHCRLTCRPPRAARSLQTAAGSTDSKVVKIVEVGPRDGLQNEKSVVTSFVKAELVTRLGRAGMKTIEAGSFVSPKWVPQMAGTPEVLKSMERLRDAHYPVLVPNIKGLEDLFALLDSTSGEDVPLTDEIAVFTAATDAFCKANTNCTIAESLERLVPVTDRARARGLRVRGYVSVVVVCPYTGRVDYKKVKEVSRALLGMGCYEVSLGDTVGAGTPWDIRAMLETVMSGAGALPASQLAGHFHDTYGTGVPNILAALGLGLRTFDSSIAGLGGCPYSPGATGNVATEDVLYALQGSGYTTPGDLTALAKVGGWISGVLNRRNESRAGKAILAKTQREKSTVEECGRDGATVGRVAKGPVDGNVAK